MVHDTPLREVHEGLRPSMYFRRLMRCHCRRLYAATKAPGALKAWLRRRKTQVAAFELAAAIAAISTAMDMVPCAEIHLFCDSRVAVGTLIRGASSQA